MPCGQPQIQNTARTSKLFVFQEYSELSINAGRARTLVFLTSDGRNLKINSIFAFFCIFEIEPLGPTADLSDSLRTDYLTVKIRVPPSTGPSTGTRIFFVFFVRVPGQLDPFTDPSKSILVMSSPLNARAAEHGPALSAAAERVQRCGKGKVSVLRLSAYILPAASRDAARRAQLSSVAQHCGNGGPGGGRQAACCQ
jgi:hypothetical protein